MQIQTIPEDFIINPTFKCLWTFQSDFLFKALRIVNDTDHDLQLLKISFVVKASGKTVKEIRYQEEALENQIKRFSQRLKNFQGWNGKVHLGREKFWNPDCFTDSLILKPNQETGTYNEFFLVVHDIAVDELVISVDYLEGNDAYEYAHGNRRTHLQTQEVKLPVLPYQTKNSYIFPVQGVWQVNGNYDCIGAHRTEYSMEFAFDLCQLNRDSLIGNQAEMMNEDFIYYGKDILAIADGEVVDCFNECNHRINFPEDSTTDPNELAERKAFIEQHGNLPFQCGNYVVLKHANEEYSLYGHLIYHSLKVKKGERVRQGQPIGQLGNTGRSGCPHLHFQLMNGPDYSTARGLPCHFTNITDVSDRPLGLISEEYTIVQAK